MRQELTMTELKARELEMLKYIDSVCKENNIDYYIDCGTLLGAVRHQGFIPWDDDIDIAVDRKDYKKLLSLLSGGDRYKILSMYHHKKYYYLYAKLVDNDTELIEKQFPIKGMGVFVDIFPLEHLPSNVIARRLVQWYVKLMRSALRIRLNTAIYAKSTGVKGRIILFMSVLLSREKDWQGLMQKLDTYLTKKAKKDTSIKVELVASSKPYRDVPEEYYGEPVQIKFEDCLFSAPCEYKKYLTLLYGDYMQLPPVTARVSNHDFKAYLRQQ